MNLFLMFGMPLIIGFGFLVLLFLATRIMPAGGRPKPAKPSEPKPVRDQSYVERRARRTNSYRRGVAVLLGLGVLTVLEFIVAQFTASLVPMFIIGLGKAALIVQYFMHLYMVWTEEEAH